MNKVKVYVYKDVRSSVLENRIKKMRTAKGWTQAGLAKIEKHSGDTIPISS